MSAPEETIGKGRGDTPPRRGVVLDLGSVLVRVDIDDFEQLAGSVGASLDELVVVLVGDYADDNDHPFHRAERGEITLAAAIEDIETLARQRGFSIGPIRQQLLQPTVEINRELLDEVARLREQGWRTGVITNSVLEYSEIIAALLPWDDLFDIVVDSSQVGIRKPDHRIFARALELLDLEPEHVVFIDDQPGNVAAAAQLGMRTIRADRFDAIAGQLRELVQAWTGDKR